MTADLLRRIPIFGLAVLLLAGAIATSPVAAMAQPPEIATSPDTCDDSAIGSGQILLAQSGCCSSHNGVCGCSSAGETQCCDGTQSPTCTCAPPPPPTHTLTITSGPTGTPNPVASGAAASLSVTAVDSLGHALSYGWTASCPALPSNGAFSNAAVRTPAWTSPTNETGSQQSCTMQVTVNDGNALSQAGSFAQGVASLPPPPPTIAPPPTIDVVATGCTTCHPGGVVGYHVHITNPGPAMLVELKGGARFPDGTILGLFNQETTIPSGTSVVAIVPAQTLPQELPAIDLTVEAAILEPELGVTLGRHGVTLHLLP